MLHPLEKEPVIAVSECSVLSLIFAAWLISFGMFVEAGDNPKQSDPR